ncbi:MAG: hypothetical protein HY401_06315 [Elusimicrobia bacterium]|nr:hypothetical protein [Elusimicrobiota bacterium]
MRSWRRKRIFWGLKWLVFCAALGAAGRLAAAKFAQMNIWPVRGMIAQRGLAGGQAREILTGEVISAWQGRNRFVCVFETPKVQKKILADHPNIKIARIHLWPLVLRGEVELSYRLRQAAAVSGRGRCLDEEGFEFPCPASVDEKKAVWFDPGISVERRKPIFSAMRLLRRLGRGPMVRVGPGRADSLIFSDNEGVYYEFRWADIKDARLFEPIIKRVGKVLEDRQARKEKFRYIDGTLAAEGRVFIKDQEG